MTARWRLAVGCLVLLVLGSPAYGQTLKATAPVPTSPANGAQLGTLRPALTVLNATGIWVPATFNYRFEVASAEDPGKVVVSAVVPQTNSVTVFTPPMDLDFGTTYVWSARAELDGAIGPRSISASFRTPAAPPPSRPLASVISRLPVGWRSRFSAATVPCLRIRQRICVLTCTSR